MTKKTISKNITYSALSQTVIFGINFLLFPFIVQHVGAEIYGAYLLVMTFTGYLGVFDFGVGSALIKYVAEGIGRGEEKETRDIISASFTFYFCIGLISCAILLILSFSFQHLFKVDLYHMAVFQRLFWVAAAASLVIWTGRTFESVLQGFQRYDVSSTLTTASSLATAISAYVIFSNGLGMGWFLAASYFFIALRFTLSALFIHARLLPVRIVFPFFERAVFKKIFGFSMFLFFSNLAGLIIFNFDNFLIGALISVSAVSIYGAGYIFQNAFRMVNSLLGGPLFPAASHMEGQGEEDKQRELFLKGTKYITLCFVPLVIVAIIFAKSFILFWMGDEFSQSILPAQLLMLFWIFNNTGEVGSGLLAAKGHVRERFKIDALNAILNIILSLFLVRRLGIVGVALGTTIPMILVAFPLTLRLALRVMGLSFSHFFRYAIARNLVIYVFAALLSFSIVSLFPANNIIEVLAQMALVYAISLMIGFAVALNQEEQKEIISITPF